MFTLELRNKYSELYNEDSDATEQFAALLKAKDHAAELCYQQRQREREKGIQIIPPC